MINIILIVIRAGWVVAFIGGSIYLGTSNGEEIMPLFHVALGCVVTVAMLMLIYKAMISGVARGLVFLAAVWTVFMPMWGLVQRKVFPDNLDWIGQVLHVVCVIGLIGLAEVLGARMKRKDSKDLS